MKILVLYNEVAGYLLSELRKLRDSYNVEVEIVLKPSDPNAPIVLPDEKGFTFHNQTSFGQGEMVSFFCSQSYQLVFVGGWTEKQYLKIASFFKQRGIPTVLAIDNQWKGTPKQRLASLLGRFYFPKRFSYIWVPGLWQFEYARRLGFPKDKIHTGMYSANTPPFNTAYQKSLLPKTASYPHSFLFVGRLLELKGLEEFCQAFLNTIKKHNHNWNLVIVGKGPMESKLPKHERIKYSGYINPEEIAGLVENSGCFVLPGRSEAWGVVIHEFAAAGLPIVASNIVGAITAFVADGFNGYIHESRNENDIESCLMKIIGSTDDQLIKMGKRSHELSLQISPEKWAATLMSMIQNHKSNDR